MKKLSRVQKLIIIVFLVLLAAVFGFVTLRKTGQVSWQSALMSALSVLLFAFAATRAIPELFHFFSGDYADADPHALLGERSLRRYRHPWLKIALVMLATRLLVYIVTYAVYTAFNGYSGGIFNTLKPLWTLSDAPHYLGIAENWYVTMGDAKFHIVFFPFYPIMIKAAWFLVGNYFTAAMLVTNLASIGAAILTFELAALDMDARSALRAVKYTFILPAAMFFSAPMSDSLFLLFCLGTVFLLRKKQYLFACILAALASFTRSLGILLAVPIFIEYARDLTILRRAGAKKRFWASLVKRGACMCIIPLGLVAYLYINYAVTGNAFQFLLYQKDHWYQSFGWFFNTAAYQTDYAMRAISSGELSNLFGLWIPNLIYTLGSLLLIGAAAKRLRPSYTAFFLIYFAISIGVTWLLSGPRYLAVAFPLTFAVTHLTRNKYADAAVTLFSIAGFILYAYMFVSRCYVY